MPPKTQSQVRIRKPKKFNDGTICYTDFNDGTICYTDLTASGEPYNLQEALASPHWKSAMDDEHGVLV
jgi:hypothetical protein